MIYNIQPNIVCENCIKCGKRPVIEQIKKGWLLRCPDNACDNSVSGDIVDFDAWNRKYKPVIPLTNGHLKKSV
jgi:ssDNA-binding Zn-finger/Zn-ribbon topoisomerase 1